MEVIKKCYFDAELAASEGPPVCPFPIAAFGRMMALAYEENKLRFRGSQEDGGMPPPEVVENLARVAVSLATAKMCDVVISMSNGDALLLLADLEPSMRLLVRSVAAKHDDDDDDKTQGARPSD